MGFPIRRAIIRTTLIGVMLGGGLLFAGISQAQDAGAQEERSAELIAAAGGPAPTTHLIAYVSDKTAVEARDAEVAGSPSEIEGPPVQGSAAPPTTHVAAAGPSKPRR